MVCTLSLDERPPWAHLGFFWEPWAVGAPVHLFGTCSGAAGLHACLGLEVGSVDPFRPYETLLLKVSSPPSPSSPSNLVVSELTLYPFYVAPQI